MTTMSGPLCMAPFTQLTFEPTGRVSPCCYLYTYELANIKDKSVDQIWQNEKIRKLRQEMSEGRIPKICQKKAADLKCFQTYEHLRPLWKEQEPEQLIKLDLRLNGQCNLKCVMCSVWQEPNEVYNNSSFWQQDLEKFLPRLHEIEILGGEPLIQRDTFRLLKLIREINPQCQISLVTNASYILNKKVFERFDGLRLRQIQISLDSLKAESYAQIRKGGDFALMMKNINLWSQYLSENHPNSHIVLSLCALKQNYREIPDFIDYALAKSFIPQIQFAFFDPSGTSSLIYCSHDEKRAVIDFLLSAVDASHQHYIEPVLAPLRRMLLGKSNRSVIAKYFGPWQNISLNRWALLEKLDFAYKHFEVFPEWPSIDDYNHIAKIVHEDQKIAINIHFFVQPELGQRKKRALKKALQESGETFLSSYCKNIVKQGNIPTRLKNWHDFFNVLIWMLYPQAKMALHKAFIKYNEQETSRTSANKRNNSCDRLTQFDEGGAILVIEESKLDNFLENWFQKNSDDQKQSFKDNYVAQTYIFGHGLIETFVAKDMEINGLTIVLAVPESWFHRTHKKKYAHLDQELAKLFETTHPQHWKTISLPLAKEIF